jgi:hypothetical protein
MVDSNGDLTKINWRNTDITATNASTETYTSQHSKRKSTRTQCGSWYRRPFQIRAGSLETQPATVFWPLHHS